MRAGLAGLYHYLATSEDGLPRAARRVKRRLRHFELDVPRSVARPALLAYVFARDAGSFLKRVLVCQPFFRAYCKECGPGLRTGDFVHWVQGQGDIIVGSNVSLDGKSTITFAARFSERPTLVIGDGTSICHDTEISIGKRVIIGKNCRISGATRIFDSNGHPTDPEARRAGLPPDADAVRPVTIGDNVWIAKNCIIFPGVRIGEGAVISAGSVVRGHVPPYAVVAGNPARIVFRLPRPGAQTKTAGGEPFEDRAA